MPNEGFLHKILPQPRERNFKAHQRQERSKQAMALLLHGAFSAGIKGEPGIHTTQNPLRCESFKG